MNENVFSLKKYENLFHYNKKDISINVIKLRYYRLLNNEFNFNDYIIETLWIDINFIEIEIVCFES